jgi:hypothetical protein
MSETVVCGIHGKTPACFACRHVAIGIACGWHGGVDEGWCDYCEERVAKAGEWTKELAADLKVLCTHCFAEARENNRRVPGALTGFNVRLAEDEQHQLFQAGLDHTNVLQARAQSRWDIGVGGKARRWDFDEETRTVRFSDGGTPVVIADARMVGTYSTKDGSFQWAWVPYPANEPLIRDVVGMRAFGEIHGIERLTRPHWHGEIEDAWEVAALAAYLIDCDAVYRAPWDDDLYAFLLLNNFRYPA